MALFEGTKLEDITLSVTTTMQGDVFSAIKAGDNISLAFFNGVHVTSTDFQPRGLALKDCQVDIMGNTNYNLEGIGNVANKLIQTGKYGEVRITSSGSSTIDIVNMLTGKMEVIVDLRAIYDDSWATLQIADIASMYRFIRAVGFYITDVYGKPLDAITNEDGKSKDKDEASNVIVNRRISLVLAKTEELGGAIVKDLAPYLRNSIDEWKKKIYLTKMPKHPDYDVITPFNSSFKCSYVGEHKSNRDVKRFVHIISLNDEGEKFLGERKIGLLEYIQKEFNLALITGRHPNIMSIDTPRTLDSGLVAYTEPVCDTTLDKVYVFGKALESPDQFFDHMAQILDGLAFCHRYEPQVIHGDLKLDNIGIIDGTIKLDDFGVSSLVRELNEPDIRGKNIGSIDTRAPELFELGNKITTQTDVYSIGAITLRMFTGYYPTPGFIPKPVKGDENRPKYEEDINEFRQTDYTRVLQQRMSNVPEDISNLIMRCLDRDPHNRPVDASTVKEEFDKIRKRYEAYRSLAERVKQDVVNTKPSDYLNPHLEETEQRLLQMVPNASYAERLAALMHDYERATGRKVTQKENEDYESYKKKHAERSARIAGSMLKERDVDTDFIDEVATLIRYHDRKNLPKGHTKYHRKIEQVRDADALSFFENNLDEYLRVHSGDDARLKTKILFMHGMMSVEARRALSQSISNKISHYLNS